MKPDEAVTKYLANIPEAARPAFSKLRAAVHSAMPREAEEVISYRIPAMKLKKVVVWYAAFAKHCSLFPTAQIIQQFKSELKDYKVSKGTIHFPLEKPIPALLVKKIVKARLAAMDQ